MDWKLCISLSRKLSPAVEFWPSALTTEWFLFSVWDEHISVLQLKLVHKSILRSIVVLKGALDLYGLQILLGLSKQWQVSAAFHQHVLYDFIYFRSYFVHLLEAICIVKKLRAELDAFTYECLKLLGNVFAALRFLCDGKRSVLGSKLGVL